jgi:hypothetical protein
MNWLMPDRDITAERNFRTSYIRSIEYILLFRRLRTYSNAQRHYVRSSTTILFPTSAISTMGRDWEASDLLLAGYWDLGTCHSLRRTPYPNCAGRSKETRNPSYIPKYVLNISPNAGSRIKDWLCLSQFLQDREKTLRAMKTRDRGNMRT